MSFQESPARARASPAFSVKGKANKTSHSSTKHSNMTPPNSPPHSIASPPRSVASRTIASRSIASAPSTKCQNMSPAPFSYQTPTRNTTSSPAPSMSSHAGYSLSCSDSSDVDPNGTNYEGSKANPFISNIDPQFPERNHDGFVGVTVSMKRTFQNDGEYKLEGVVVTKTGNSADIIDLQLWEAEIPRAGDFHYSMVLESTA
jgi:hypothetical protein